MRKRCIACSQLTEKWEKVNSGPTHCYDGCFSTTGSDRRTIDGKPAWLPHGKKKAWDPSRVYNGQLV